MNVTVQQLDTALQEINEIFRKMDERIKALEEARSKTRSTTAKKDAA